MKQSKRVMISTILALVLVVTVLIGAISTFAARPTVALGTVNVSVSTSELIDELSWRTNFFTINTGKLGTCIEPRNSSPNGTYSYGERTDAKAKLLIACLLTAPVSGKGSGMSFDTIGSDSNPIGRHGNKEIYKDYYNCFAFPKPGSPAENLKNNQDIYYYMMHYVACMIDNNPPKPEADFNKYYGVAVANTIGKISVWANNNEEEIKKYRLYATMPGNGSDKQSIIWIETKHEDKGGAKIIKTAAQISGEDVTAGNNCYGSLSDATYGVYTDQGCTSKVGTLYANGAAMELEPGTYWVKETKAPAGYKTDSKVYEAVVKKDETATVNVKDVPETAPIGKILQKKNKKGTTEPSLAGAEYKFSYYAGKYTKDNLPAEAKWEWVMKTDENGEIIFDKDHYVSGPEFYKDEDGTVVFPYGTVKIVETKAPEGYLINPAVEIIDVATYKTQAPNDRVVISIEDEEKFGAVGIKKVNVKGEALAGATIGIYSDAGATNLIKKLVTDENGMAYYGYDKNSNDKKYTLKVGDAYYFKELAVPPPKDGKHAYKLSTEIIKATVSEPKDKNKGPEGGNIKHESLTNYFEDSYAKLIKTAAKVNGEDITKGNSCYGSINDAEYTVYKDKECKTSAGIVLKANGAAVGIGMQTYWVKETKAPLGYLLDSKVYEIEGIAGKTVELKVEDVPDTAPIGKILQKTNSKGNVVPSLAGAEYEFSYYAGKYTKDNLPQTATRKWIMKTDESGQILFDNDHYVSGDAFYKNNNGVTVFPYGTVKVVETKAPTGYIINTEVNIIDVETYKKQDPEERVVKSKEDELGAVAIKKTNESGDLLEGVKIGIYSDPEATNLIEELVTDENGIAYYGYDEATKEFSLMPGDTYYFKEIEQPKMDEFGNEYYLSEEIIPVTVASPENIEGGIAEGNIAYGYLENFFKERLKTKAFFENGIKEAIPTPETKIVDQVECKNLKIGKEYTIKGALYDVEIPENVLTTGETTFTATEKDMLVEVEFMLDASALSGKTVVVFEDMYKDEIKVATHSELTDKDQQVSFPEIVTSVGESTVTADMDATITDTLSYTNLTPGRNYTVEGLVMDKETGEPASSNGEEIRATAVFTPDAEDGQVDVVFAFDASGMAGQTLVVFEEVYDEESGELIGEHKDLEDGNQTFTIIEGAVENIDVRPDYDDGMMSYDSPLTGYENRTLTWLLLGITAVGLMITCIAVMRARRKKDY